MTKLLQFAVIGNPIGHSLSPNIHQIFAKQTGIALNYERLLGDLDAFETQVQTFFQQGGMGLNVTLPFKERAMKLAQSSSEFANKAQAANTLMMREGQLHAENTDGMGLVNDLSGWVQITDARILILGAGGATRGILGSLLALKPERLVVSNRTLDKALAIQKTFSAIEVLPWEQLSGQYDLIINATSLGYHGQPITLPATLFANHPHCYDLSYDRNKPTPFVAFANTLQCETRDGLGMLIEQAAEAFKLWHGVRPQTQGIADQLAKNS